jgi:SpoVK/Ycf46/Vps4 family AAA+-type ATPase
MEVMKLRETKHPNNSSKERYNRVFGLEQQKSNLLLNLRLILDHNSINGWKSKYHGNGLELIDDQFRSTPLILLSGDVGCGKTELASCIGSPLALDLGGKTVKTFETPSDIRGGGLVGELSARITSAFREAKTRLKRDEVGLLIIDEADDIATGRDQKHTHHEDKAGVNALIKEIDLLEKSQNDLAVLFITNRSSVMDPAIVRRAITKIEFNRPNTLQITQILEHLTKDIDVTKDEFQSLIEESKDKDFTYSDFFTRISRQSLIRAWTNDVPYSFEIIKEVIKGITPTPKLSQ